MFIWKLVLALGAMIWSLMLEAQPRANEEGDPPAGGEEESQDQPPRRGAPGARSGSAGGTRGPRGAPEGDGRYYRVLKFTTKEDLDEHYNRVFTQRHRKMKDTLRKEIEDDVREEVQAEYAEDKEAAQKAVGRRAKKIETLQGKVEELEGELESAEERVEQAQGDAKKYAKVIESQWEEVESKVPDYVKELIEDKDVLERLDYVNRHRDKLLIEEDAGENGDGRDGERAEETPAEPPSVIGAPPTPPGTQLRDRGREADQEAQQDYMRTTHGAI